MVTLDDVIFSGTLAKNTPRRHSGESSPAPKKTYGVLRSLTTERDVLLLVPSEGLVKLVN
jgi:hypothetical protein